MKQYRIKKIWNRMAFCNEKNGDLLALYLHMFCVFLLFIWAVYLIFGRITIFVAKDALSLSPYPSELYLTQVTFWYFFLYVFDSHPVERRYMSIDHPTPPPPRIWSSFINAAFRVFYKSLCIWVSSVFYFLFLPLTTTLFSNEHTFWCRILYFCVFGL